MSYKKIKDFFLPYKKPICLPLTLINLVTALTGRKEEPFFDILIKVHFDYFIVDPFAYSQILRRLLQMVFNEKIFVEHFTKAFLISET